YNLQHRNDEALSIAKNYYQKNPTHYIMGMLLAKTYLLTKKYRDAAQILDKIVVIPYEGATDGMGLYKEAHLMLAVEEMKKNNSKKAINEIILSKQWPVSLGVGKPYQEDIDERLENFLLYHCYTKLGDKTKSATALEQIKNNKAKGYKVNEVITAWVTNTNKVLDNITPGTIEDENKRVLSEWLKK
ncbi:MAG: tetratricopeptide repeat protein, partial [Chitinophagaceae bacterium]